MRHRKQNTKFGRSTSHRAALVSMLVVGLIKTKSIKTTLPKAKVARQMAEKMVTLARKNTVAARRLASARLHDEEAVKILFDDITKVVEGRPCGFTRISKLGKRQSDGSEMCVLSWVMERYGAEPAADAPKAEDASAPAEAGA